jgi:hypothetical protein
MSYANGPNDPRRTGPRPSSCGANVKFNGARPYVDGLALGIEGGLCRRPGPRHRRVPMTNMVTATPTALPSAYGFLGLLFFLLILAARLTAPKFIEIHIIVSNHRNGSNIHGNRRNQVQIEYQMIKYAHRSVKSSSSNTHRIRYLKYIAHVYLEAKSPTTLETGSG